MAQHLWALVPLGLVGTSVAQQPQRLDFSCSEMELSCLVVDETLGTWGQYFVFAPKNLTGIAHILLCVGP